MKRNISIAVAVMIILGGIAAYFFWSGNQPEPETAQVQAPPPKPAPKVEVRQVIEAPPEAPPLPALADSDTFLLDALAGLINNKSLMEFLVNERIIHRIVATIDNLPRRRVPMSVMPVKRVPGKFLTSGKDDNLTISTQNAARYAPYMKIAETIDTKKLVGLYIHLYPLFQEAYEGIGYPGKYFNDRLIVALDDMLAAPDINEPVKLVQPSVYYQFADPNLEGRSIGQRIMMRIGSKNEAVIKAKLNEIKQELKSHMREQKIEGAA